MPTAEAAIRPYLAVEGIRCTTLAGQVDVFGLCGRSRLQDMDVKNLRFVNLRRRLDEAKLDGQIG